VPDPRTAEERLRADVIAAAVEWVDAHDELAAPSPLSVADPVLLERYSDACIELLAVVSQNRNALADDPVPVPLDVERLRAALYNTAVRHTWGNAAAVELATETAREYAALPLVRYRAAITAERAALAADPVPPPLDVERLTRLAAFAELVADSQADTAGTRAAARYALTGSLAGVVDEMRLAAAPPEPKP
jgi:hypothetical protein